MAGGHELRLLEEARNLVARSWTQGTEARSRDGRPVAAWSDQAASWSLLGALVATFARALAAGDPSSVSALKDACARLADVLRTTTLKDWNDTEGRTQAEVLQALDVALKAPASPATRRARARWN